MEFDNKKIWHDILESIKVSVSPAIFTTWFAQTYIADIQKGDDRLLVEVGCASTFVKTTIETRYYGLVQDSLSKMLDSPCDIIFIVKDNPDKLTLSGGSVAPLFDINLEVDNKKLNAIKSSGLITFGK